MEHTTNHHNPQQMEDQDSLGYTHHPPLPHPPLRVSAFSKPSPPPPLPARNENDNRNSTRASDPPVPVTASILKPPSPSVKYKECLRNHAATIGGYVLDGCGEFMATEDGNTVNSSSMKCAACGCHRSFHQKETQGENYCRRGDQQIPLLLPPPPPPTINQQHHFQPHQMMVHSNYKHVLIPPSPSGFPNNNSGSGATTESSSEERKDWKMQQQQQQQQMVGMSSAVVVSKKRHRTKFNQEQKERMMEFAERVGWRFQKQDEAAIEEICREVGVRRHVLKVWMHNNKHSIKKQQQQQQEDHTQLQMPEPRLQPQLQQQQQQQQQQQLQQNLEM